MNRKAVIEWIKILAVAAGIIGYITFLASRSEAHTTNSLEERQTRALEKIATELSKTRQCQCRK